MSEEHSVTENEAPKEVSEATPLTREELAAKLEELSARAKAAGLSPLRATLDVYARRGASILDGFLSALEEGQKPTKPSPKKKS